MTANSWRQLICVALVATLLSACGLGTEVGNGLKPAGNGSGKATSQSGAPAASDREPEKSGAVPEPTSNSGQSNDNDNSAADTDTASGLGFDATLLLVECASPFAENLTLPATLRFINASQPASPASITVALATNQATTNARYAVSDSRTHESFYFAVQRTATSSSPGTILNYTSQGERFNSGYSCVGAVTSINTTITLASGATKAAVLRKATVTKAGQTYALQWFVSVASDNVDTKQTLIEVDVSAADDETKTSLSGQ